MNFTNKPFKTICFSESNQLGCCHKIGDKDCECECHE